MNYTESIRWLYSFDRYGSKLGLERITTLVNKLGNPQDSYQTIHVTGTNGKGSVCQFIGSILIHAGYNVGIYISPHLQRFSERIVINNTEISKKDLSHLIGTIKPVVEDMISEKNIPTFFEITTALAFQYFKQKNVDFAVVEVGLGGRHDATNVVNPLVSVITNISLEHTQQLGKTIESIAFEKAGIIKKDTPVITAATNTARAVIVDVAHQNNASTLFVEPAQWKRTSSSLHHQEFLVQGDIKEYHVQSIQLGKYQGENIALSLKVIEQLQMKGLYITDKNIDEGIKGAFNPGRMELISKQPLILLDGAHNPQGMKMLRRSLTEDFLFNRLVVVLGILGDKDIDTMLGEIIPMSDVVILTKSRNARACDIDILKEKIRKLDVTKKLCAFPSVSHAVDYAKSITQDTDMICITGSLFTVGEARDRLGK